MTTTRNPPLPISFLFPCYLMALLLLFPPLACRAQRAFLSRGSHLSVDDNSDVLVSPDESFACGFHQVGDNAFMFSVWFSGSADKTVAWTANRDREVNGRGSRVTLRKNGNMVLTDIRDADSAVVWETKTTAYAVDRAELLDSGNLVVKDVNGSILWQSFDSPTDTLLPTQPMTKHTTLVSSRAKRMVSSGYYKLFFDSDNVLKLIYDTPEISSIYWPNPFYKVWTIGRTNYNNTRYGVLDEMGQFAASDHLAFKAADLGPGVRRRLTLDYDGNLRLHSLDASRGTWSVAWQAISQPCDIHGTCGMNGICLNTLTVSCSCPPGFVVNDPSGWRKGCSRMVNISCTNPHRVHFMRLPQTDFWGFDLNYTAGISYNECKRICEEDCSCQAFGYRKGSGECFPKTILFNSKASPNANNDMYLKFPRSVNFSALSASSSPQGHINCSSAEVPVQGYYAKSGGGMKWHYFYWFITTFFVIEAAFIIIGWWFIAPWRAENSYEQALSSQFKRFSYKELKKATKNFKDVLGRGGSGSVYKGKLEDDRVVAIKKLEDIAHGEVDFQAELSVIDMIYHKNLVKMFGFCAERSHRLLVSEFVQKGSLDKYLAEGDQGAISVLPWSSRLKIATGAAEGLAYLHHECFEWVVHCDVKPENILLDEDFEPKIADFGLAKLLNRRAGGRRSNLSRIRGTRGYIAPEWASSLPISEKVDVYSYGVVLLELVKGRRVSDWVIEGEEEVEMVLRRSVAVLREKLQEGSGSVGETLWISDVVDGRLDGQFNKREAVTMVEIAIACLEEERNKRPTMESVVQMLLSSAGELNSDNSNLLE